MTNAPFLLDRARGGSRLGYGRVVDHVFPDGLEDAYGKGRLMGAFAVAHQFTRAAQDDDADTSLTCARNVIEAGGDRRRDHCRHGEGRAVRVGRQSRRAARQGEA